MDEFGECLSEYRKTGSAEAARKLIEPIIGDVHLFVAQKVKIDDAPDLSQDILLEIVKSLHLCKAESRAQYLAWCYGIARHLIAKHYRRSGKEPKAHPDFDEFYRLVDQYALHSRMTEAEQREMHEAIEMLKEVSPEGYDLLFRRHVLDMDLKEIGDDYGISADAVRMRIKRCLENYPKE
jgi:RNA polymerase sigma factor (sigma-70 family)